jgi:hypothetical protein
MVIAVDQKMYFAKGYILRLFRSGFSGGLLTCESFSRTLTFARPQGHGRQNLIEAAFQRFMHFLWSAHAISFL